MRVPWRGLNKKNGNITRYYFHWIKADLFSTVTFLCNLFLFEWVYDVHRPAAHDVWLKDAAKMIKI